MTDSTRYLTSAQAAARLGVKPATLYAYVSRGLLARHRSPDGRSSLFDPTDLARLERRSRARHGSPTEVVVASELTLIDPTAGRLWFRGLDPLEACRERRFEEIASWLWTESFDAAAWRADPSSLRVGLRARTALRKTAANIDKMRAIAAAIASKHASDGSAFGVDAATDLLSCLVECLPGDDTTGSARIARRLWPKLTERRISDPQLKALDAALSLTADHGLTYSTLAARVTAAAGAGVAAAVASAMGAGIASADATHFDAIEAAIARTQRDGPGAAVDELDAETLAAAFSHGPYPAGDPRARVLLEMLGEASPDGAAVCRLLADEMRSRGAGPPTVSFAQAALAWTCDMRPGSGETISLVSRAAGWIAHALEEHRRPTPFRPRLAYIGPPPRASTPRKMLDAVQDYLSRE